MNDLIPIALEKLRAIEQAVTADSNAAARQQAGVGHASPEVIRCRVDNAVRIYCAITTLSLSK